MRPLLARIAKVAADESGVDFNPYDGRYRLRRAGESGPVYLDIELLNSPGEQRISIERKPVASPVRPSPELIAAAT